MADKTVEQLEKLQNVVTKDEVSEGKDGNYMVKQQLFVIAQLAQQMYELMEDGEEVDDWMETKIAQSEMGIVSAVKAYMYEEFEEGQEPDTLDYDELIIGR